MFSDEDDGHPAHSRAVWVSCMEALRTHQCSRGHDSPLVNPANRDEVGWYYIWCEFYIKYLGWLVCMRAKVSRGQSYGGWCISSLPVVQSMLCLCIAAPLHAPALPHPGMLILFAASFAICAKTRPHDGSESAPMPMAGHECADVVSFSHIQWQGVMGGKGAAEEEEQV